jgi:glycogen(starch) synthase
VRALIDHVARTVDALRRGDPPPPPDEVLARLEGIPPPPEAPAGRPPEGGLRVALIRREYPPETAFGGIATYTYNLARGLADAGHQVTVVTGGPPLTRADHDGRVDVVQLAPRLAGARDTFEQLNRRGWLDWGTASFLHGLAALRAVRQLEAAHGPFDVLDLGDHGADGLPVALFCDAPRTVRLHAPWTILASMIGHGGSAFELATVPHLESALLHSAAAITAPSRDIADRTRTYFCLDAPIARVPNPVDTDLFSPAADAAMGVQVCFVGRADGPKGILTLLEAAPQVLARAPFVTFEVVGSDPGNLGASLTGSVARSVRFLGRVPHAALPDIYRRSALSVVPSLYDNSPNTAIEAMACGIPVVASSAGGTPEYVLDRRTGLVVPPRDPEALADAVVRLATDVHLRERMGRAARAWVVETCSRAEVTALVEEQYRLAMAGQPPAHDEDVPVRIELNTARPERNRIDAVVLAGIEDGDGVGATVASVQEQGAVVALLWDGPIAPQSPSADGRTVGASGHASDDAGRLLATLAGECFFVIRAGEVLTPAWVDRARRGLVAGGGVAVTVDGRRLLASRTARGLRLDGARSWDEVLDRVAVRAVERNAVTAGG